ncbi:S9 family peptidase [Nitriliruptoraceae bacterium ZYF776]|nr:S9 family peptidase [Profundirhabdus halotolerans]
MLFGDPERAQPALSPDGTQLAFLAPDEGVMNVWLASPDLGDARPITADRDRGIHIVVWADDGRHLLYVQDEGGDENWRLHAVDVTTGEDRDLTPFDGVQARIVATERRYPDTLLVGLNRDDPALHDVYRLTLSTGELELVYDNPGFIGFVADHDLRVRAGLAPTEDGGMSLQVRDGDDEDWRELVAVGHEDALGTAPIGFDRDGTGLYVVTSLDANTGRLLRYEVATGAAEVLAEDARYDLTAVAQDPETYELRWVSYLRERLEHELVDPAYADDVAALAAGARGDWMLLDETADGRTWLIAYEPDDGSVSYQLYDRGTRQLTPLLVTRPELERFTLARMEPFQLAARDGLELHGYLTAPPGIAPDRLPTVLLVHGGPWHRDSWGFDAEVQWLANRGYLVLQVNFRGSTGYGKAFSNAGDREWGAAMHDDLLDTVDWAVEQGYADPDRVAIYGGSYGGYAALFGATFTPDRFRCAVDLVGPSDLRTLIASVPPYWGPLIEQFHRRVGHPEHDAELLWSRSPLSKADQVSIPLLIAQGANDPRVKQAESEQFVAALREKGIPHEYLLFEDEGHGFVKPANKLRFYAAAEAFLAEHLGGRAEDG